jgi:2-iminobutanoate/2-iminopropanoate deaminase
MTKLTIDLFDTGVLGDAVHATQAAKVGDFVYVGGSLGNVFGEFQLIEGGVGPETTQALQNMKRALEAAGSSIEKVIKCTVFLVDVDDFGGFNEAYAEFFGAHRPTRTTVAVHQLGLDGRVEIECVALA